MMSKTNNPHSIRAKRSIIGSFCLVVVALLGITLDVLIPAVAFGQSVPTPSPAPSPTQVPVEPSIDDPQDTPEILQRLQDNRGRRSQQELNAIRDRRIGTYERENPSVLRELHPVVSGVRASTFEVINPTYWVSVGTVVTSDGYAITKASELEQDQPIKARFGRDKTVSATIVKIDTDNDIALLKLEEGTYQPVHLHAAEPQPGQLLLSVGVREPIMTLGVCSCEARSLLQRNRGQIGVVPEEAPDGIAIYKVQNAAYRAGLRDGDVIVSVQGREVKKVPEFVSLIRKYRAGDELIVKTKRGDSIMDFTVRLGNSRNISVDAPRFEAMNLLGSINSQRASSFPWAMQHDSPLLPEQCGGPLVNLSGDVVGVNIARAGRTASYALTGEHLAEVLRQLEIPGWPTAAK
ncbi:MAG: trypsin-like peptidase domain-containing protein [Planctomycetaceae bacterium]|nr:trypsin-like peptidase domain-containing protein [Planctomycetaceae bacterium]